MSCFLVKGGIVAAVEEEEEDPEELPPFSWERCSSFFNLPPTVKKRKVRTERVLKSSYNVVDYALPEDIKKALTLTPKVKKRKFSAPPKSYPIYNVHDGFVSVPRVFGIAAFMEPTKNLCDLGDDIPNCPDFNGRLLDYQTLATKAVLDTITRKGSAMHCAMLQASCGCGKTVCSIYIASQIKKRVAVLVHKQFLGKQWAESIERFWPGVSIGFVNGNIKEEGNDVTIFSLQTVMRGKLPKHFFKGIGLLICDECHHLSAEMFSQSMRFFPADKRVGLTATPNRADGLGYALHYFLGPIVFRVRRNSKAVTARIVNFRGGTREILVRGEPHFTLMESALTKHKKRNELLVKLALDCVKQGRKVILLSARRKHLEILHDMLGDELSGLYMGETTKKGRAERELSKDKPIMLASIAMSEEGLDIPALDTMILATPRSSLSTIEQCIGRILRSCPGKQNPRIIDVADQCSIFYSMAKKRRSYYEARGYSVKVTK